jgi:hypothetical protein
MDSNKLKSLSAFSLWRSLEHLRGHVKLGVIRSSAPLSLVRTAGNAYGRRTTLEQERVFAGLRKAVGSYDTAVAGAHDDVVIRLTVA